MQQGNLSGIISRRINHMTDGKSLFCTDSGGAGRRLRGAGRLRARGSDEACQTVCYRGLAGHVPIVTILYIHMCSTHAQHDLR